VKARECLPVVGGRETASRGLPSPIGSECLPVPDVRFAHLARMDDREENHGAVHRVHPTSDLAGGRPDQQQRGRQLGEKHVPPSRATGACCLVSAELDAARGSAVAVARTQAREMCDAQPAESHANGFQLAVGTPLSHCFLGPAAHQSELWHMALQP